MKRFVLFIFVFLFAGALQARDLFRVLPEAKSRIHTEAVSQTKSVRVEIDKDAFTDGDVIVNLEGKTYRVTNGVVEWTKHDVITSENIRDYVARFTLENSEKPSVLVRHENVMAGMLVTPENSTYELDPDKEGYRLTRVDMSNFHCEALRPKAESASTPSRRRAVAPHQANYRITLAEFYTPLAEANAGGQAQMEALIRAAVAMLNTSTHQSGIPNVSFDLVYTGVIQWDETKPGLTLQDALNFISGSKDAATLRNQYKADLVGLWFDQGGGVAWAIRSFSEFGPQSGFHATARNNATWIPGFEHEVGHNLGNQHNAEIVAASSTDDFPFARGVCTMGFITIMSYATCVPGNNSADQHWIPYFSNTDPRLTYNGQPMGSDKADNVRMMRIGAPIVANYFPAPTSKSP